VREHSTTYDVIVIGAGASGGWAAKRLSEAGVSVGLLDAGRPHTEADSREHIPAAALKYRNMAPEIVRRTRPRQQECYACTEYNYDWFVNDLEEPYTTPADKPFSWQGRLRITGGRTNVWARQSYRLSDLDFKAASFDGHGQDWPIGYDDLARYYDLVEEYIGVSGHAENVPELPDGRFLPPMPFTCPEVRLRERVKDRLGRTVTIGRAANLTRPHRGRAACHYCGPCERGCATHSYFNAAFTTVADAIATGRCTHIPNAMVCQVIMDADRNRARGARYVDRTTREVREVFGRIVILCAQALESVRYPLQLGKPAAPERARQLQRGARTLPSGSRVERRRRAGRVPRLSSLAERHPAAQTERVLRHSVPQHAGGPTPPEVPARVWHSGRLVRWSHVQLARDWLW